MFIGELLCLIIYGGKLFYQKRLANKGIPTPMSPTTKAAGVI